MFMEVACSVFWKKTAEEMTKIVLNPSRKWAKNNVRSRKEEEAPTVVVANVQMAKDFNLIREIISVANGKTFFQQRIYHGIHHYGLTISWSWSYSIEFLSFPFHLALAEIEQRFRKPSNPNNILILWQPKLCWDYLRFRWTNFLSAQETWCLTFIEK